jgi:hypothetical protein
MRLFKSVDLHLESAGPTLVLGCGLAILVFAPGYAASSLNNGGMGEVKTKSGFDSIQPRDKTKNGFDSPQPRDKTKNGFESTQPRDKTKNGFESTQSRDKTKPQVRRYDEMKSQ